MRAGLDPTPRGGATGDRKAGRAVRCGFIMQGSDAPDLFQKA